MSTPLLRGRLPSDLLLDRVMVGPLTVGPAPRATPGRSETFPARPAQAGAALGGKRVRHQALIPEGPRSSPCRRVEQRAGVFRGFPSLARRAEACHLSRAAIGEHTGHGASDNG